MPTRPPEQAAAVVAAVGAAAGDAVANLRVLLVAPRDSYRTASYVAAARELGIEILIASEGKNNLSDLEAPGLQINLSDVAGSLEALTTAAQSRPFAGVVGTDDSSVEFAVRASMALQLPHNSLLSVQLARRKDLARNHLAISSVKVPRHWKIDLQTSLAAQLQNVIFPCVVKPVALSGSRGVIRANNPEQLEKAIARILDILTDVREPEERETLLIEEFIPGFEVAVEGLLSDGHLEILAIFDKPDPLDGPYFEETYYITPSRHTPDIQTQITDCVSKACAAYGMREGPVHAECRVNADGVWILEVAARTIGGLCGRLLRFGTGYSLEELVLMHALNMNPDTRRETGSAGVLMIPIPRAGILRRVEGILAARHVPHIEEVVIDVREGYELVPLPEGSSYLGFIFANAPSPAKTEAALREAYACLRVVVAPLWRSSVVRAAAS